MSMIRLYTFLIFVAIATVILYVFFVMPQPNYISKTSLLIIPQTEIVASNTDNVIDNIVFISQSALDDNEVVKDDATRTSVVRLSETSIIQFVVRTKSPIGMGAAEDTVIKEALTEISKYYDLNVDFTIKVVKKEAIHNTVFATFALYVVLAFVAVGLIAGVLALFYMIDLFQIKSEYNENINGEKIFAGYHSDKELHEQESGDTMDEDVLIVNDDIDTEEDNINSANNDIRITDDVDINLESEVKDEIVEKATLATKSEMPEVVPTTPGNLPVVDVSDFGFDSSTTVSSEDVDIQGEESAEPTEEELKARLNELLGGKL